MAGRCCPSASRVNCWGMPAHADGQAVAFWCARTAMVRNLCASLPTCALSFYKRHINQIDEHGFWVGPAFALAVLRTKHKTRICCGLQQHNLAMAD